jgi:hypothetical protein
MDNNTWEELRVHIQLLSHTFDAFKRTKDHEFADMAKKLLKKIKKEFKFLDEHAFDVSKDEFKKMMSD